MPRHRAAGRWSLNNDLARGKPNRTLSSIKAVASSLTAGKTARACCLTG
ncbi:MAG: hypothetical protein IT165_37145 [Bryobacterales bacterium]|nr:hypothetical protein [Bryobacterales bacterium]